MIISNKYLGISTEDVNAQKDLTILYMWLDGVQENITSMNLTLQSVKKGSDYHKKISNARSLQGLLKQQIQSRINVVKSERPLSEYIVDIIKEELSNEDWITLLKKATKLKKEDERIN